MPKRSQKPSARWFLFGSYAALIFVTFISSAFFPDAAPRTGIEEGVSDLVELSRILFVLLPCLIGGSLIFLGYLFYEKQWNQRKWFSKRNLDQGLIYFGFLVITVVVFLIDN